MTEINCILPDVLVEMILKCCIFYSAKEVIEIRLLSKEYMYLHRLTLIKFRRIYFITKLLLTKNYLSDFKRKALKEGKPYKEPGLDGTLAEPRRDIRKKYNPYVSGPLIFRMCVVNGFTNPHMLCTCYILHNTIHLLTLSNSWNRNVIDG